MGRRFVKEEHYVEKGGCGWVFWVILILFVLLVVL